MSYIVYGYGVTGQAVCRYFDTEKINYVVVDRKKSDNIPVEKFYLAENFERWHEFSHVVKSPGIPFTDDFIQECNKYNINITSEIDIGYNILKKNSFFIAVTGTNGKSTTVSLIAEILKEKYSNVYACGNIGKPLIDFHEKRENTNYFVVELSSYQLEKIESFSPDISVLLNLTEDHMERHGSIDNYKQSKKNIYKYMENGNIIANREDFSPIISKNNKIEFYEKDFIFDGKTYFEYGNPVLEVSKINLVGKHNYQNISYALKAARLLEIDTELIINALENFKPVEHRIEYCGKYNNIEFYNDSKSTTFESTYAAIESFEKPVHLILSGVKKKGMNVKEFYFNIKKNKYVVKILIFGKICEEYKEFVTEPDILYNSYDWELFLKKYINEIENNSIILFSPGMPSFDYFTNFEHRGKFFKQVVAKVIKDS